jgi:hypothetical protein
MSKLAEEEAIYLFSFLQAGRFCLEFFNLLGCCVENLALGEASLYIAAGGGPAQLVEQGRLLLLPEKGEGI